MNANFILSTTSFEELPQNDRPQIALVGRSNVGKSTLINHLTGQKALARVSSEPGRTQTMNLYDIDGRFYLVDLPGYGFAKASQAKRDGFSEMIEDYLLKGQQLKLVLLVIDSRRLDLTDYDQAMLAFLQTQGIPLAVIVNKVDKLSKNEYTQLMRTLRARYPDIHLIAHASTTSEGRNEILGVINETVRDAQGD